MYKGQIYIKVHDTIMERDTWINTEHIVTFYAGDAEDKRIFKASTVIEMSNGRIKVSDTVDEICERLVS